MYFDQWLMVFDEVKTLKETWNKIKWNANSFKLLFIQKFFFFIFIYRFFVVVVLLLLLEILNKWNERNRLNFYNCFCRTIKLHFLIVCESKMEQKSFKQYQKSGKMQINRKVGSCKCACEIPLLPSLWWLRFYKFTLWKFQASRDKRPMQSYKWWIFLLSSDKNIVQRSIKLCSFKLEAEFTWAFYDFIQNINKPIGKKIMRFSCNFSAFIPI